MAKASFFLFAVRCACDCVFRWKINRRQNFAVLAPVYIPTVCCTRRIYRAPSHIPCYMYMWQIYSMYYTTQYVASLYLCSESLLSSWLFDWTCAQNKKLWPAICFPFMLYSDFYIHSPPPTTTGPILARFIWLNWCMRRIHMYRPCTPASLFFCVTSSASSSSSFLPRCVYYVLYLFSQNWRRLPLVVPSLRTCIISSFPRAKYTHVCEFCFDCRAALAFFFVCTNLFVALFLGWKTKEKK